MAEKAVAVETLSGLEKISLKGFSRLYFGPETCERKLPVLSELEKARAFCKKHGLAFSLMTPFATDTGIAGLRPLIKALSQEDEVIVNDFGVLELASQAKAEPVCGRLLNKQFRDPRIAFFESVPKEMLEHLSLSQASAKGFRKLLSQKCVKRVELDNLLQGISTSLKGTGFCASLYCPLVLVSATRMCLAANSQKLSAWKKIGVLACNRECLSLGFEQASSAFPKPLLVLGNGLFFENRSLPEAKTLDEKRIDRIVFNGLLKNRLMPNPALLKKQD
jgi:hypothetical protein